MALTLVSALKGSLATENCAKTKTSACSNLVMKTQNAQILSDPTAAPVKMASRAMANRVLM